MSTDSHDSVASHGDLRAGYESIKKPSSSKLVDTYYPSGEKKKTSSGDGGVKMKKKHKKHHKHREGHHSHHCHKSHKHKRHKSGESSGSSKKQEQTKFVVRSPLYLKSDQEDHETSEAEAEASQDESEHHNSSDEEVGGIVLNRVRFVDTG